MGSNDKKLIIGTIAIAFLQIPLLILGDGVGSIVYDMKSNNRLHNEAMDQVWHIAHLKPLFFFSIKWTFFVEVVFNAFVKYEDLHLSRLSASP